MSRIDDFIAAIRDRHTLTGSHIRDGLIRRLVVYMACRDGVIEPEEAEALAHVFPGLDRGAVHQGLSELAEPALDLERLVQAFTLEERPKLLELAQLVARVDERLVGTELGALLELRNVIYD